MMFLLPLKIGTLKSIMKKIVTPINVEVIDVDAAEAVVVIEDERKEEIEVNLY